jgi:hypothetical protein
MDIRLTDCAPGLYHTLKYGRPSQGASIDARAAILLTRTTG